MSNTANWVSAIDSLVSEGMPDALPVAITWRSPEQVFWENTFSTLSKWISMPEFFSALQVSLGMAGTALLTIFIPLAIASFNDNKRGEAFYDLDRHISLDYIFRGYVWGVPRIVIFVGYIFVPLILLLFIFPLSASQDTHFDSYEYEMLKNLLWLLSLVLLLYWGIGMYHIIDTIKGIFRWLNVNNKYTERFASLEKEGITDEIVRCWRSVWQSGDMTVSDGEKFFAIFANKVDPLLQKISPTNLQLVMDLLFDFNRFIEKYPAAGLNITNAFPKILSWHYAYFEMGKKRIRLPMKSFQKEGQPLNLDNDPTRFTLRAIMGVAFIYDLLQVDFFQHLTNHLESVKDNESYVKRVTNTLFDGIVENIETNSDRVASTFWDYEFPQEWKITETNLRDEGNVVVPALLQYYINWAHHRIIQGDKEKWDRVLDEISRNLLPQTDPRTLANMLTFIFLPYSPSRGRLATVAETPPIFGHRSRTYMRAVSLKDSPEDIWEKMRQEDEKEERKYRESTLEFILRLFPGDFTEDQLSAYIKEAEALQRKYPAKSREWHRLKFFIDCFDGMLVILGKPRKKPKPRKPRKPSKK